MFRRLIIILSIMLALAGTVAAAQGNEAGVPEATGARLQEQLNLNETQKNGIRALQETRQKELGSLRHGTTA